MRTMRASPRKAIRNSWLPAATVATAAAAAAAWDRPSPIQVWVYGKDGDTLFRLIALGSDELQKEGYTRKGSENVVGPMPPFGGIVKSNDRRVEDHCLDQVGESIDLAEGSSASLQTQP